MVSASRLRRLLPLLLSLLLLLAMADLQAGEVQAVSNKVDPALQKQMAANSGKKIPIILEMTQPQGKASKGSKAQRARDALGLLGQMGGDADRVGELPLVNGAAGFANARAVDALSRNPNVAFIHADLTVRAQYESNSASSSGQLGAPYPFEIRANKVWQDGTTGKGVAIAVLDSGIAANQDLTLPTNRLLAAVNFAGDLGGTADAGGHGTHIAGIVAGNSTHTDLAGRQVQLESTPDTLAEYVGIAPGANLVDVRILDSQGNGRISSVVAGIQWVLDHKDQYNIRVINLSLGAPISASYRADPLSAALEIAWKRGLVVVTAAGNGGPGAGLVQTPGIDPYLVTVGADDDQGTPSVQDDTLASFSSWGTPLDSTPKPDLIAPGRKIVSLRAPGSYLDSTYPDRVVAGNNGPNYFRLSGTSMATAVVSGVAALMLEKRPGLNPDQVKAILDSTTQPFGQNVSSPVPDPAADGHGLVNAYAAVNSLGSWSANRGLRPSDGFARAIYPVIYGQPLTWKDPTYAGINWSNLAWDNLAWDNLAWDNLAWDNLAWDNLAWDSLAWSNLAWDNLAWDNLAWDRAASDAPPN